MSPMVCGCTSTDDPSRALAVRLAGLFGVTHDQVFSTAPFEE